MAFIKTKITKRQERMQLKATLRHYHEIVQNVACRSANQNYEPLSPDNSYCKIMNSLLVLILICYAYLDRKTKENLVVMLLHSLIT